MSAITAAGITYALTRACTSGDLVECSCDKNHFHRYNVADEDIIMAKRQQWKRRRRQHHHIRQPSNRSKHKTRRHQSNANTYLRNRNVYRNVIVPDGDWQWGGCGDSDNVMFGFRKSKEFLDARYQRLNDIRTLVKLHNNNAGRLVSSNNIDPISFYFQILNFSLLTRPWKVWWRWLANATVWILKSFNFFIWCLKLLYFCILLYIWPALGVSGACTIRTCWMKMVPFREIGNRLKRRFDGAAKMIARNDGHSFMPEIVSIKQPTRHDLVYTEDSMDFCRYNAKTGSLGTSGRECNATSAAIDGCDLMCCSRGYEHQTIWEQTNCQCMFKWCCQVTCNTCYEQREINTCK